MVILNSNIIRTGITLKKRFIFDENYIKKYAKKDKLKWLIIGLSALVLIIIIIVVILMTRNNETTPTPNPVVPNYELKDELTIESGSLLPEVTDYFNVLENIDRNEIKIIYPDEFELTYDTTLCTDEELEEIYSTETPDFESYSCVQNYLITPATYGVTIELQGEEHTVTLNVVDSTAPYLETKNVEIYEGDTYELMDFIEGCSDISNTCDLSYYTKDTDEDGNAIDYSKITSVGEHVIRIVATDRYDNTSEPVNATLTILEVEGELFTVTFNSNGGSEVRAKRVGENGMVMRPTDPTKEGYTFVGWYLNNEEFDFNTKITSDLTLTAKWEEITENEGQGEGETTNPPGPINISSISLNYQKIYLSIDETKTVTARIYPANATNKNVTWTSSNTKIATVSNGNITGVGTGTATITATAGGKSASVTVEVTNSGSGTTCKYGNTTYNTNYVLSLDLTQNNCAIAPNSGSIEINNIIMKDYSRLMDDLNALGLKVEADNFSHNSDEQKIRNTSGTGLVGYQITISIGIVDPANPYMVMEAKYIIKSDGSRQFISNKVCNQNGTCLNS